MTAQKNLPISSASRPMIIYWRMHSLIKKGTMLMLNVEMNFRIRVSMYSSSFCLYNSLQPIDFSSSELRDLLGLNLLSPDSKNVPISVEASMEQ